MGVRDNIAQTDIVVKYGITLEQIKTLRSAMYRTWNQVYYDLVECFEGGEAEMESVYDDEAAMIAENTLDADRVTDFCRDIDLKFVYELADGSRRDNVIKMGEDILRAHR
jgi:hypothetical protein